MDRNSHPPTQAATRIPNIGVQSARWLAAIGIHSLDDLRQFGAVEAYVRLKREVKGVSLNLLYALVGAVQGMDWREVRREQRLALVLAVDDMLAAQIESETMRDTKS